MVPKLTEKRMLILEGKIRPNVLQNATNPAQLSASITKIIIRTWISQFFLIHLLHVGPESFHIHFRIEYHLLTWLRRLVTRSIRSIKLQSRLMSTAHSVVDCFIAALSIL